MARGIITAPDMATLPLPQGIILWGAGLESAPGFEVAEGSLSVNDPSYTRPALCHARYPQAAASAGTTGGVANHTHAVPSHVHTAGTTSSTYTCCRDYGSIPGALDYHTHSVGSSSGSVGGETVMPAYIAVRPFVYTMKAGGGSRGIVRVTDLAGSALPPRGLIVGFTGASTPAGWRDCDGGTTNGFTTPNLIGKYLKGVPDGSTNPGATGGAASHSHQLAHGHGVTTAGAAAIRYDANDDPKSTFGAAGHTHPVTSCGSLTSGSASNDPPFQTLRYLCFVGYGAGGQADPRGTVGAAEVDPKLLIPSRLIAIWAGALSSIPSGWMLSGSTCGRMLKHVGSPGDAGGATGGANTHTHAADAHTHSTGASSNNYGNVQSGGMGSRDTHTHTTGAPSYESMSTPVSNEPPYYEVAFIEKT